MGRFMRQLAHLETLFKKLNCQKVMSPHSLKMKSLLLVSRQTLRNMRAGIEEKSQMTWSSIKFAYLLRIVGCVLISSLE